MDLVEFLRARLDEDEAKARAALSTQVNLSAGPVNSGTGLPSRLEVEVVDRWHAPPVSDVIGEYEASIRMPGGAIRVTSEGTGISARDCAEHIARHDPARVLAEVDAKRQVIAWYEASVRSLGEGLSASNRHAVQVFAGVYADHPDYDEAWRPQSTNLV